MDQQETPAPPPTPAQSPAPPPPTPEPVSSKPARSVVWQLLRMFATGLLAAFILTVLITDSLDRWEQANRQLATQAAEQQTQLASEQNQVNSLRAEVQALEQRK